MYLGYSFTRVYKEELHHYPTGWTLDLQGGGFVPNPAASKLFDSGQNPSFFGCMMIN